MKIKKQRGRNENKETKGDEMEIKKQWRDEMKIKKQRGQNGSKEMKRERNKWERK
jgi:hypothetical protein